MVKQKVENETKRQRFQRLATIRTQKVIEKMRVLSHCSNIHQYEYDSEDVKKIFSTINKELRRVKNRFEEPQKAEFRF